MSEQIPFQNQIRFQIETAAFLDTIDPEGRVRRERADVSLRQIIERARGAGLNDYVILDCIVRGIKASPPGQTIG